MSVIQKIQHAANKGLSETLDQEVYLDRELHLYGLRDSMHHKDVFVDAPLKAVVALGRNDFWNKGDTWRSIVGCLTGEGWSEDVFDYFESELLDNPFPALYSRYELKLMCIGGACSCVNGNHRLAAAKSWLIARHGEEAILKKVKVSYYPIHKALIPLLEKAQAEQADLFISIADYEERRHLTVQSRSVEFFITIAGRLPQVFAWLQDELVEVSEPSNIFQRFLPWLVDSWYEKRQWDVVPLSVIVTLLDSGWIEDQLKE